MINGCKHYNDCFTCPFADCIASNDSVVYGTPEYFRDYYQKHKSHRMEYQKKWRAAHKEEKHEYDRKYRLKKRAAQSV